MKWEINLWEARQEGETVGMAKGIAKGRIEGKAEGIAEGIAEGMAKGIAEGVAKANADKDKEYILSMHESGLDNEQIARIAKVSFEQVESILQQPSV